MLTMTEEQKKVYHFILQEVDEGNQPPTVAEIAKATGTAASLVHRRILALEKKGYLTREGYRSLRNVRIAVRI